MRCCLRLTGSPHSSLPLSDPDGQGEAAVRAGQPAAGAGEGAGQHDAVPAREGGLRGRRRAAAREERETPGELARGKVVKDQ